MQIPINESTNISQVFAARVSDTPDAPAYRQYSDGVWKDYTWRETAHEVARWQAARCMSMTCGSTCSWVLVSSTSGEPGITRGRCEALVMNQVPAGALSKICWAYTRPP